MTAAAQLRTAAVNICTDPDIKSEAEQLFASFGITISDAINIFLCKSIMEGGLPFEVKQPRYNAETEAAILEARAIMKGEIPTKGDSSAKALFTDLNAELDGEEC